MLHSNCWKVLPNCADNQILKYQQTKMSQVFENTNFSNYPIHVDNFCKLKILVPAPKIDMKAPDHTLNN